MTAMRCLVKECHFYANEGCYGTCSQHSTYKAIKIIAITKPALPKDVLDLVWEFYRTDAVVSMTDDQIIAKLGMSADVLVETETMNERALWLRYNNLPYLHCDNIDAALDILHLPAGKHLRTEDAQKFMVMIDMRNPPRSTRIAMEKAIVIKTLNRGSLPMDMFSVGMCYHGRPACMSNMSVETLRRLVL